MMTYYRIIESGTGDELGMIEVDSDSTDEMLIETLAAAGYLDSDQYAVDDGYPFLEENQRAVVDFENNLPALILETPMPDEDDEPDDEDEWDDEDEDETEDA